MMSERKATLLVLGSVLFGIVIASEAAFAAPWVRSGAGQAAHSVATPPDIIFVVTGAISSSKDFDVTPACTIPVGGAGSAFSWFPQIITYPTGQIASSGNVSGGALQAHFNDQLAFSPTRGSDSYSTHVTVNAYVRGAKQCFRMQCASSGIISVSHAHGCDPASGPSVQTTWNGQSVGALSSGTAIHSIPTKSEACSDAGTPRGYSVDQMPRPPLALSCERAECHKSRDEERWS